MESGISIDFREIGWQGVDWTHLAQGKNQWWAFVNMVMNVRVPYNMGILTSCMTISFSRRILLHGVSQPASRSVGRSVGRSVSQSVSQSVMAWNPFWDS